MFKNSLFLNHEKTQNKKHRVPGKTLNLFTGNYKIYDETTHNSKVIKSNDLDHIWDTRSHETSKMMSLNVLFPGAGKVLSRGTREELQYILLLSQPWVFSEIKLLLGK